jgi:hypothetical protein
MSHAAVSNSQFHFSRFGGYSGLAHALLTDLKEIPNLADGELTRPGKYLEVIVSSIVSHGNARYTVYFAQGETYLHQEDCTVDTDWFKRIQQAGGVGVRLHSLLLVVNHEKYSAGYLDGNYYLIEPGTKLVAATCFSADELMKLIRNEGINLRPVKIQSLQVYT